MAKSGFFTQGMRGKVGNVVFQKTANGDTMVRERVTTIKNPKTLNQTLQRVLVNTCSQAYSALQPICYHAFQGEDSKAKNQARFMKLNLKYFRHRAAEVGENNLGAFLNFCPVGDTGIRPGAYIISEGSLPKIDTVEIADGLMLLPLSANTYEAVINDYDLQRGDQLTFCVIDVSRAGNYNFRFARVILDPRTAEGDAAELSSALIVDNAVNLPSGHNQGNFGSISYADGALQIRMKEARATVCAAVVVSRKVGDTWKRSEAQFVVDEQIIASKAVSLARAINLSLQGDVIDLSNGSDYLNNAGIGGAQSTDSGASQGGDVTNEPSFDNSVVFTANGSSVSQNVSGSSVALSAPLTYMRITGSNIDAEMIEVSAGGQVIGTVSAAGSGRNALNWNGEATAANSPLTVKKVVEGSRITWFTIGLSNPVTPGDSDDGGGGDGFE